MKDTADLFFIRLAQDFAGLPLLNVKYFFVGFFSENLGPLPKCNLHMI